MKQTIRMTETELRGMIQEAVNKEMRLRKFKNVNENRTVRMTESQLRGMINKAVNEALEEMDYKDYKTAQQQHPGLMNKVDPRTFANRERGVNAQGNPRNDDRNVMQNAAKSAWNNRYGFNNQNGNDYYEQKMGGADNFSHNADAKYGVNYRSSTVSNGQRNYTNYAYNPKSNTEWHGDGSGNSQTNTHTFDGGDNGAHRVAHEMENGTGKYNPNTGWQ